MTLLAREPVTIRHAEPGDFAALQRIFAQPRAYSGTMQLPCPSAESWRKKLENPPPGFYSLVACVLADAAAEPGEVVGHLGLQTSSNPRRRHVGSLGMAVRDDWQGKG